MDNLQTQNRPDEYQNYLVYKYIPDTVIPKNILPAFS